MKTILGCGVLVWVLLVPVLSAAEAPQQIAGIRLGAPVEQYRDLLRMDSALPVRHMEYLSEITMQPSVEGYQSGYIFVGNCEKPGRITKIKLKYERDDKAFFDELVQRFKHKFGEPDQYRGDAFRAFIAWKWSFKDKDNNKISLILQHNSADVEEYTQGNAVKLSATSFIEQEASCHERKNPEPKRSRVDKGEKKPLSQLDFQRFVPE